jgi:hypothetical protein
MKQKKILFFYFYFKLKESLISNEIKYFLNESCNNFVELTNGKFASSTPSSILGRAASGLGGGGGGEFVNRDLIEEAKHDVETDLNKVKKLQTKLNQLESTTSSTSTGGEFCLSNHPTTTCNNSTSALFINEQQQPLDDQQNLLLLRPATTTTSLSVSESNSELDLFTAGTSSGNSGGQQQQQQLDYSKLLESSLNDLISKIDIKKRLINELETNSKSVEQMRVHYEEKMSILHDRIKQIEDERDRVILNMSK